MSWELLILKVLLHYAHPLVTSFSSMYFSLRAHNSYQHLFLFIWTKNMFHSLWDHSLPPDLQCLFFSFRTDNSQYWMSQIGLGILSRPQSVESTFKELFSVTVFSLFLGILYQRDVYCYLSFIEEGTRRLDGVSRTFFFSINYLSQTLLCKLLATLNVIRKILYSFITLSLSLHLSLAYSLL